jgi:hypothetical protein
MIKQTNQLHGAESVLGKALVAQLLENFLTFMEIDGSSFVYRSFLTISILSHFNPDNIVPFYLRNILAFTQPRTEMNTRNIKIIMFLGSKVRRVLRADNLTAISEPIV